MRQFLINLIIILFLSQNPVYGQDTPKGIPEVLENLFSRLNSNFNDAERIHINDSIRLMIDSYVRSDSIFNHRFTNLKYLGQVISTDSLLKIVTWNLVMYDRPGIYFSYFIRRGEAGEGNKVYNLKSDYSQHRVLTDTTYTAQNWYGALYYDLKPYLIKDKKCWVLLGIDYGNPLISKKIIDVLSFSPDNTLLFGWKWFESGDRIMYRDVFEYSSTAMMTMRFSSEKSIVFDHLVPFNPALKGDHQFYGPDYSYDAYTFENGIWKFSLNVDVRNKE